ncbi:MAG TPA: hypothetical protein VMV59_08550 [Candidatus Dormibacteraeota bacterium]|nr:hypothetical protein [Candidatus Dormibacteraeota bacterium]
MKKLERRQTLVEFLFDIYGAGKQFRIGRTVAAKVCDELPKFNRARLGRGESEIHFLVDGQDAIFELSNAAESTDGGAQSHAETGDAGACGFQRCL